MGNSVAHSFEMFVMGRNLPILQVYVFLADAEQPFTVTLLYKLFKDICESYFHAHRHQLLNFSRAQAAAASALIALIYIFVRYPAGLRS